MIETDSIRQELIQSNDMLRVQIWILGGLISFLLVILIAFAKGAWNDMKNIVSNLEIRVDTLEKKEVGASKDVAHSRELIEQVSIKLDLILDRNA